MKSRRRSVSEKLITQMILELCELFDREWQAASVSGLSSALVNDCSIRALVMRRSWGSLFGCDQMKRWWCSGIFCACVLRSPLFAVSRPSGLNLSRCTSHIQVRLHSCRLKSCAHISLCVLWGKYGAKQRQTGCQTLQLLCDLLDLRSFFWLSLWV